MDRSDRPRENPAPATTGREAPPEALRDGHGSARQSPAGDRDAAKVTKRREEALDEGLEETFPGSDPASSTRRS